MPWSEIIAELEDKLLRTWRGTFRPLDGVPVFQVYYPQRDEREALRQMKLLAERIQQRGRPARCVSLVQVLKQSLAAMLGAESADLLNRLQELEREKERTELAHLLADQLPDIIVQFLVEQLGGLSRAGAAILIRSGSLMPFVRPSLILPRLENRLSCTVVMPIPEELKGYALYSRGERINWR